MNLLIDLCDPADPADQFTLTFVLNNCAITKRWQDKVLLAQALHYPIDDPTRFYNFDTPAAERHKALKLINDCIDQINSHSPIIDRKLSSLDDQDTLNYLHHIFEEYHGLLDQQNTDFWVNSPKPIQTALSNLNNYVHRCESTTNSNPRMTVTYYGLPKVCFLEPSDYQLFTPYTSFGDIYLNYVEIGKTLSDLWQDQDQYIHADAFQPFQRFSADFSVRFYDIDPVSRKQSIDETWQYFDQHADFFNAQGYQRDDIRLSPFGVLPLGRLTYDDPEHILNAVRKRQRVTAVRFK